MGTLTVWTMSKWPEKSFAVRLRKINTIDRLKEDYKKD